MATEFHGLLDEHPEGLRKPLYLQGQSGLRVELDGPALRIAQPERAMVFYPLARLARVLSKGGVYWSSEALLACADAGIPVVFLQAEGGVRAYLFGRSPGAESRSQSLPADMEQMEAWRRYQMWRNAMALHAQRALIRQLHQRSCWTDPISAGCPLPWGGDQRIVVMRGTRLWDRLRDLLAGLSAQLLIEAGIDAMQGGRLEQWPLMDDLTELLVWTVLAPIGVSLSDVEYDLDRCDERCLIALVETHQVDVLRFGRLVLAQLRQSLEG